jgi:very-short-patch-repair endonuclease
LRPRVEGSPVFRRQHPLGLYILDFYCAEAKLCVEVDGQGHGMGDQPERDERRDRWLLAQGIEVLRIPAGDVLRTPDVAAERIRTAARERIKRS